MNKMQTANGASHVANANRAAGKRPVRKTTTTAVVPPVEKENTKGEEVKGKGKGIKRSTSENQLGNNRKRTAFGDLTNAIQSHANRISLGRTKAGGGGGEEKAAAAETKPTQLKRASRRLKKTRSTNSVLVPQEDALVIANKELTIQEQCDEILSATDVQMEEVTETLPEGVAPFDLDDDPDLVHEYARSIFQNMRVKETRYPIKNYLSSSEGRHCNATMRSILVDWLVEVQESLQLYHETLYVTVKLIDYFLQSNDTPKERLQLVGTAALLIACKMEEYTPPQVEELVYICDNAYNKKMFVDMEKKILMALNFDINIPIPYRFLRRFWWVTNTNKVTLALARFVLELSLHTASFVHQPSSKMAAACLCLAMKMTTGGEWDINHVYHCGYTEEDVMGLMKALNQMLVDFENSKLKSVKTKYSHPLHHSVAKIAPLPCSVFL